MTRALSILLAAGAIMGTTACKSPMHLSYDFGRAFNTSFASQADLTRPSVATAQHSIAGYEATMIRLNSMRATADKETETNDLTR